MRDPVGARRQRVAPASRPGDQQRQAGPVLVAQRRSDDVETLARLERSDGKREGFRQFEPPRALRRHPRERWRWRRSPPPPPPRREAARCTRRARARRRRSGSGRRQRCRPRARPSCDASALRAGSAFRGGSRARRRESWRPAGASAAAERTASARKRNPRAGSGRARGATARRAAAGVPDRAGHRRARTNP